jgi:hypothetical protein
MADLSSRRGLGILAWRNLDALDEVLAGYERAGLLGLFGERRIWFQEMDEKGLALAEKYGLTPGGTASNEGILGGFKRLATAMQSEVLLLLEDDLPLVEGPDEVRRQIDLATRLILNDRAQVVRLRSRRLPGQKFALKEKFDRYWGPGKLPALRRRLRPGKAKRLAGGAVYQEEMAERKHRGLIDMTDEGAYLVSAACLPWTNQSIMISRDFYLKRIIAHAEAKPSRRRVNGFPDIEKEWNSPAWRHSGWKIAVPEGLFTHERPGTPEAGS